MPRARSFTCDYVLLFATLALIIVGILFIYSSSIDAEGRLTSNEYIKQIIWAVIGFFLMLGVSLIKYNVFYNFAPAIYTAFLLLLLFTLLAGTVVNGARSWLGIGSLGIQPSEFMKIVVILTIVFYLEKSGSKEIASLPGLLKGFLFIVPPIILIFLQPDLGTAIVYIPIAIAMFYTAGAKPLYLGFIICTILCTGIFIILPEWESIIYQGTINFFVIFKDGQYFIFVVITLIVAFLIALIAFFILRKSYFFYISYVFAILILSFLFAPVIRRVLQDHQMMRLLVFLDPYVDPQGAGWNIIQSVTAIGSGGVNGKGFLAGTQSHLQFLPQQSTDFIFSILAEEWGFLGSILITVLYAIIIIRGISIAGQVRDRAGSYIAIGICTMLFFHFAVSVGMAIGFMPITGIPLLFLSYGGSSLWTAMIGMGLLISISRSRFV